MYSSAANPLLIVMFSWPSNGEVFLSYNYFSDREDAEVSGIAMARALQRFAEFLVDLRASDFKTLTAARRRGEVATAEDLRQCERKIHLVAHSMGNWALRHALVKFAELHPGHLPRMFPCLPDGGGRG
jgi:esterase/lipase superfamily enzyme